MVVPTLFPENCPDCGFELGWKVCKLIGEHEIAQEMAGKLCKFHEDISDLTRELRMRTVDAYVEKGVLHVEGQYGSIKIMQGLCTIETPNSKYQFYREDARAILKEVLEYLPPDTVIEDEDDGLTGSWYDPEDYEEIEVSEQ